MKSSAVHINSLTLNFILKNVYFLVIFQLPQHKNAHISAHRQNKLILWVFIFLVIRHKKSFDTQFILIRLNVLCGWVRVALCRNCPFWPVEELSIVLDHPM